MPVPWQLVLSQCAHTLVFLSSEPRANAVSDNIKYKSSFYLYLNSCKIYPEESKSHFIKFLSHVIRAFLQGLQLVVDLYQEHKLWMFRDELRLKTDGIKEHNSSKSLETHSKFQYIFLFSFKQHACFSSCIRKWLLCFV